MQIDGFGWGARIRTWGWRNQNPLPYHLATPHLARRPVWRSRGGRDHSAGPAPSQHLGSVLSDWNDVDFDLEIVVARGEDQAFDWRYVGIIAPARDHDMVIARGDGVGRVEAEPAESRAAPQRDPGVGRVRAGEALLAGRGNGADVAADVERR